MKLRDEIIRCSPERFLDGNFAVHTQNPEIDTNVIKSWQSFVEGGLPSVLTVIKTCPRESLFNIQSVYNAAFVTNEIELTDGFDLPVVRLPYNFVWFEYRTMDTSVGVSLIEVQDGHDGHIAVTMFIKTPGVSTFIIPTHGNVAIDKEGRPLRDRKSFLSMAPGCEPLRSPAQSCLHLSLNTLALIHAKGVKIEESSSLAPKAQRKRRKKGKRPLVRYKTLKIIKATDTKGSRRGGGGSSEPRAKHVVRGHFVDYTKGKGMFGNPKLKGIYWKPPHLSGDAKNGVVIKDYEVKPKE